MDSAITLGDPPAPFAIRAPDEQTLPLVFASPHSGSFYPNTFVESSVLGPLDLRRSEDSFVDEIFGSAPELGAPLIHALFPRAYVDANREPFELDPTMFLDELPDYANTRSPRVAAALGTIARVVTNGANIYRKKLSFHEALSRIRSYYWPYHTALRNLLEATKQRFGFCVLIDCHSMPSSCSPPVNGQGRMDFVLGDCHGTACHPIVVQTVERALRDSGYCGTRNAPYSGGFVTRHYGRPREQLHCLQIELNRRLYMDEEQIERAPGLKRLAADMRRVIETLGEVDLPAVAADQAAE